MQEGTAHPLWRVIHMTVILDGSSWVLMCTCSTGSLVEPHVWSDRCMSLKIWGEAKPEDDIKDECCFFLRLVLTVPP